MVVIACCETCRYFSDAVVHAETEVLGDTVIYNRYTIGRCLKTGEVKLGSDTCDVWSMRDTNESTTFSESIITEMG